MERALITKDTNTNAYYRHFKGGWYEAINTAIDTKDDSTVVVYRNLKSGQLFTRPFDEFMGPTDFVKYPDASQPMRLMTIAELTDHFGVDKTREMFIKEVGF